MASSTNWESDSTLTLIGLPELGRQGFFAHSRLLIMPHKKSELFTLWENTRSRSLIQYGRAEAWDFPMLMLISWWYPVADLGEGSPPPPPPLFYVKKKKSQKKEKSGGQVNHPLSPPPPP